jgi:hypothetical protein
MGMTVLAMLGLGFILGVRHAFDADHVVAVSTIVANAESRQRMLSVGLFWGIGHTFTLLLVGLIVLTLNIQVSASVESLFEGVVGIVLLWLGLSTLREWWRKKAQVHSHAHTDEVRAHFHVHAEARDHMHSHTGLGDIKSFLLGMIHGLAGSAALLVLVLATVSSPMLGIGYILVFGGGSIVGMGVVSLILSISFSLVTGCAAGFGQAVRLTVGVVSLAFGAWMVIETGSGHGLFL